MGLGGGDEDALAGEAADADVVAGDFDGGGAVGGGGGDGAFGAGDDGGVLQVVEQALGELQFLGDAGDDEPAAHFDLGQRLGGRGLVVGAGDGVAVGAGGGIVEQPHHGLLHQR